MAMSASLYGGIATHFTLGISMHTLLISLSLVLAMLPSCANADAFYEFIRYKCDSQADYVQVELLGAYNEDGELLISNKDENTWSPWELVGDGGSGRYIKSTRTIQKSCVLSDGTYLVEIGPKPCNYDTQGMAGAMMMAWAKISKEGKQLAHETFGACAVVNVTVTTKLEIRPKQKPITEKKTGGDYYK